MANLLIGDVHGCFRELMKVLEKAEFSSSDTLWLTGDLVARGPDSIDVLRFTHRYRHQIRLVLGNHDLHLLAIYAQISEKTKKKDNLQQIFEAPDCEMLLEWLRTQPLLQVDNDLKLVMSHAGIPPQWDLQTAIEYADEVQKLLSSNTYPIFLDAMYGDYPDSWSPDLTGLERARFSTNALTRMRYCYPDGRLDFYEKDSPDKASKSLLPWFALPTQLPEDYSVAFGHWAALNGKGTPEHVYALDTGCCWGGKLTCLRWEDKTYFKKRNKEDK